MDQEAESAVRGASKSFALNFGTNAPFAIGEIGLQRIGFARIPVVNVEMFGVDTRSLVMVARQLAYRELESMSISSDILNFVPTVSHEDRRQFFVDTNEASLTLGKRKKGARIQFRFEIQEPYASSLFRWEWTGKGEVKRTE